MCASQCNLNSKTEYHAPASLFAEADTNVLFSTSQPEFLGCPHSFSCSDADILYAVIFYYSKQSIMFRLITALADDAKCECLQVCKARQQSCLPSALPLLQMPPRLHPQRRVLCHHIRSGDPLHQQPMRAAHCSLWQEGNERRLILSQRAKPPSQKAQGLG